MAKENIGMLRIAVTGPESTGKSTLSEQLAQHYHVCWVPEYSRPYLNTLSRKYTQEDILHIAQRQWFQEQHLIRKYPQIPIIVVDTERLVTKIWSEHAFGNCSPWILENIENDPFDLYLLTYVDTPWEPDPLREHPDPVVRRYFYDWYYRELKERKANFVEIKGSFQERYITAVQAIDNFRSNDTP